MHFSGLITLSAVVCFISAATATSTITQQVGNSIHTSTSPSRSEHIFERSEVVIEPQSAPPAAERRSQIKKRASKMLRRTMAKRLDPEALVFTSEMGANKILSSTESTANAILQEQLPKKQAATASTGKTTAPAGTHSMGNVQSHADSDATGNNSSEEPGEK